MDRAPCAQWGLDGWLAGSRAPARAIAVQIEIVGDRRAVAARRLRVATRPVERDQPRPEAEGFLDVVGDHDDGHPELAPQRLDQRVHLRARAGIERAERLVEQQHARPPRQRLGDRQPLLHAARERARILVAMRRRARPPRSVRGSSRSPCGARRRAGDRRSGSARTRSRSARCRARSGAETPNSAGRRRRDPGPGSAGNGSPSSMMAPCVGRSWPRIRRRNVLLPAPDGPTTERNVPDAISRLMRSSTIWSPYSTQTLRNESALISAAPRT